MAKKTKINIHINGKSYEAEPGETIIQVADRAGIHIPRFCYHPELSVVANCRMCLVDVEKSPKTLAACNTQVSEGMRICTHSKATQDSQKSVMEFLLINHPLDCPICDQGGECELQDLAMGYGKGKSRFYEKKRAVVDEDLGPLIQTHMTRCIHCTRCIRFGEEIAGMPEIGAVERSNEMRISTYLQKGLKSEISGNIIDICPVGALTSKPFRFNGRSWEFKQTVGIAPHDSVGSNLFIHSYEQQQDQCKVMRVIPKKDDNIGLWLSNRDRFSYEAVNAPERLGQPAKKINGQWHDCTWPEMLRDLSQYLQDNKAQAQEWAALASSSSTTEEFYLLQMVMRALGCQNLDHRMHKQDFRGDAILPPSGPLNIESWSHLDKFKSILLLGSFPRHEQPMLNTYLRQASLQGTSIASINCLDQAFNFDLSHKIHCAPPEMLQQFSAIVKTLLKNKKIHPELDKIQASPECKAIATSLLKLKKDEQSLIIIGPTAINHNQASAIECLAQLVQGAQQQIKIGFFPHGCNHLGAIQAGFLPNRGQAGQPLKSKGQHALTILQEQKRLYWLHEVHPILEVVHPNLMTKSLSHADTVVSLSMFDSPTIRRYATHLLPITPFTENTGSYINMLGKTQHYQAAVQPYQESWPAWKIYLELAKKLKLPEAAMMKTLSDVQDHLANITPPFSVSSKVDTSLLAALHQETSPLTRVSYWPMYRLDALTRHAQSLQKCLDPVEKIIKINSKTAKKYDLLNQDYAHLIQGEYQTDLPLIIDDRIADDTVYIPAGFIETAKLDKNMGPITIKRSSYAHE
jgi:NADH-quinone oxidoreductase subunit G